MNQATQVLVYYWKVADTPPMCRPLAVGLYIDPPDEVLAFDGAAIRGRGANAYVALERYFRALAYTRRLALAGRVEDASERAAVIQQFMPMPPGGPL